MEAWTLGDLGVERLALGEVGGGVGLGHQVHRVRVVDVGHRAALANQVLTYWLGSALSTLASRHHVRPVAVQQLRQHGGERHELQGEVDGRLRRAAP